eukprot:4164307-Pleurochrysis_carterae.AAC.1
MPNKSYELYVLVYKAGAVPRSPPRDAAAILESEHLGGVGAIFGGKGSAACENCREREPFHVTVSAAPTNRELEVAAPRTERSRTASASVDSGTRAVDHKLWITSC